MEPNRLRRKHDPKTIGPLMTVDEVGAKLRVHSTTVRKMIAEGRIDVVRPTKGTVRIPESAFYRILDEGFTKAVEPVAVP